MPASGASAWWRSSMRTWRSAAADSPSRPELDAPGLSWRKAERVAAHVDRVARRESHDVQCSGQFGRARIERGHGAVASRLREIPVSEGHIIGATSGDLLVV